MISTAKAIKKSFPARARKDLECSRFSEGLVIPALGWQFLANFHDTDFIAAVAIPIACDGNSTGAVGRRDAEIAVVELLVVVRVEDECPVAIEAQVIDAIAVPIADDALVTCLAKRERQIMFIELAVAVDIEMPFAVA